MVGLGDGEVVAGVLERGGHVFGELEHHLHADGEVGAVEQAAPRRSARAFMSGSLSYQPVVPMTIFAPVARQARMLVTTASGVVKSMTDVEAGDEGRGEGGGVLVFGGVEDVDAVAALGGDFCDELAGLADSEDEDAHEVSLVLGEYWRSERNTGFFDYALRAWLRMTALRELRAWLRMIL